MDKRPYEPKEIKKFSKGKQCGIYQIRNKIDGKIYVGSSKRLYHRRKDHFNELKKNRHQNIHLQRAYNKYGGENFIFEIIEFCKEEEQYEIEQYWIDRFIGNSCYNINPDAVRPPDCTGKKFNFSEEHKKHLSESIRKRCEDVEYRRKMSEVRKGKNMGADHVNSRAVVCLETGKEYGGISEASRYTKCRVSSINACCLGKYSTANGFHWVYKEVYDNMSDEEIKEFLYKYNKGKQVICLETKKRYKKVIDAMEDTGVDRNNIIDCCNNIMEEAKGTHWAYFSDYVLMSEEEIQAKLRQHTKARKRCKCLETGQVFVSIAEAARELGVCSSKITSVCRGDRKTTGGYHFEYVD